MMPRNPALRNGLQKAGKLVLSAAALYLTWRLVRGVPFEDLRAAVREASPLWIALGVLLLAVRMPVWALRWGLAVRRHQVPARASLLLTAIAAALAVNQLTPAARVLGGLLRARWLQRFTGMDLGVAFGTVLYDQVAHQVVMTTATLVSVVVGAWLLGRQGLALGAAAVLAAAAVVLGAVLWRQGRQGALIRRWASRLAGRLANADDRAQRLVDHSRRALQTVRRLVVVPSLGLRTVSLGLVLFAAQVLAQIAIFRALGSSAPIVTVAVVVALGTAAGMLLGTPGGLGTTEAAMIAGFAALGIDRVDATAATLVYRALHYGVLLVLGLPAFAWLELRETAPDAPPSPEDASVGS
jgi:uncharacterized protein (TIRG00374 family)